MEQKKLAEIQFKLIQARSMKEVYEILPEELYRLTQKGLVISSMLDEETASLQIVNYSKLKISIERVIHILGIDPRKRKYYLEDMTEEELAFYRSGRLKVLEGGLYALLTRKIPQRTCTIFQEVMGIKSVYTMGCVYEGIHYGGIIILAREELSPLVVDQVEQIVNFASVLIQRNLAEFKVAEALEIARKEEAMFKLMFEKHSAMMLLIDGKTGEIIDANKSSVAYYGYDKSTLCTMHIQEINTKATELVKEEMSRASHYQKNFFKFQHKLASGELRKVEVNSTPIPFKGDTVLFSIITDVTEKEEYLKEIEEKNTFIQTVLDKLPIGIALNKINSGEAFYMNSKFEEIYGWPKEEITNISHFFECVYPDPEYREEITRKIMHDIESGIPENMHWENIKIVQKNGKKRIISALNIPLLDQDTMVSAVWDVTDIQLFQNELIKAKEEAEESNRLKTEFINNLSHEVRTPLNGITGFTNLLKSKNLSEEKKNSYIDIINESSEQLLKVITDILEISSLGKNQVEINKEVVVLDELLNEILEGMSILRKKSNVPVLINNELPANARQFHSDRHKLFKILKNLLDNALKYTEKGKVEINCRLQHDTFSVEIADTGIGIHPKNHEMIFERFSQEEKNVSNIYRGVGLGLTIAMEYAKILGGNITVKSEKGKGSSFTLTLPRYQVVQTDSDKPITESPEKNTFVGPCKILIAEDDEANYLFYEEVLLNVIELDIILVRAINGQEAVDTFLNDPELNIVLMDIKMPVMDGIKAARIIRAKNPEIPIIVHSAYATQKDIATAMEAGCNEYITKPIELGKLEKLIKKYFYKE